MQRVKQFLIVLVALVAIGLTSIACTTAPWGAPATAPPPSEAERLRALEREVSYTNGYLKGQRSVRCQKNCGGGERRRPTKTKPTEATAPPKTPAPTPPPAVAPPASPKAPPVKPVVMSQAVPLFIFNGSKQDAVDIINAIKGSPSAVSMTTTDNPCCPPTPPPTPELPTRYTFPPTPEHRTPDIAPADVPPADYYEKWPQPPTRWQQSPPAKQATPPPLRAQPQKDGCNGRPCYR